MCTSPVCSLLKISSSYLVCSKCLVLCCVVIFTSEMDGYHEGDGSRAGILFYTCYEIQEEVLSQLYV